jgi:uncharacterized protein (DUF58 family)
MQNKVGNVKKFLDPDFVSNLKNLDFIARMIVEGFLVGLHKSPYHGFSVEFSEHRQYMPGDNIKTIDWKVYSRTNRFYIKQFEEETNLKAYILLDVSGSMQYTSGKISKLQYAKFLAASLSYLLINQRDAVGLATFSDRLHQFLPPKASPGYLNYILKALSSQDAVQKETKISEVLHEMAEKIKRRGLIIILSDFLYEDPKRILEGLKHFRHYKHEILVFNILDPNDRFFKFQNETTFVDLETGEKLKTQPYFIREQYQKKVEEFYGLLQRECQNFNIDFQNIYTNETFDKALFRYLLKRKRMF